jgi:hypothetical protein
MAKIIGQAVRKAKLLKNSLLMSFLPISLNIVSIVLVMPQAFFHLALFVPRKSTGLSILALSFSNPRGATLTSRVD